jgi:hypothetical protein
LQRAVILSLIGEEEIRPAQAVEHVRFGRAGDERIEIAVECVEPRANAARAASSASASL